MGATNLSLARASPALHSRETGRKSFSLIYQCLYMEGAGRGEALCVCMCEAECVGGLVQYREGIWEMGYG